MEIEPQIVAAYIATGKAKLVYRHLLQLGERSARAAEASECAADQGKFWELRAMIYQRQRDLAASSDLVAALVELAREQGLDSATFADCMNRRAHLAAVQADEQAAQAAGVRFRPTFEIAGQRFTGAVPFERFQQVIDAALASEP